MSMNNKVDRIIRKIIKIIIIKYIFFIIKFQISDIKSDKYR
jgi:hypothetical protein